MCSLFSTAKQLDRSVRASLWATLKQAGNVLRRQFCKLRRSEATKLSDTMEAQFFH
jgi:hypothetical protein